MASRPGLDEVGELEELAELDGVVLDRDVVRVAHTGHSCPSETSTVSVDQHAHRVDQHADQAADDGAVDPDELQVAADVQLDPAGRLLAVPALDGVGDDRGQLGAVPVDGEDRGVGGQAVQPGAQLVVGEQPVGERRAPR